MNYDLLVTKSFLKGLVRYMDRHNEPDDTEIMFRRTELFDGVSVADVSYKSTQVGTIVYFDLKETIDEQTTRIS